ncbi:MAG: NUDIX domain-containing protein [Anaerolineales bacterium]|nr:NUDIX domain-containing protein [Anaerolineales bacterium]
MPKPNEYQLVFTEKMPLVGLVTAVFGLIFSGGRFLMTKLRSRGWDIPGGHVEPRETPEETVRREIYEETAVRVTNLRPFAHKKFTIHAPQPPNYKYPYPLCYQLFLLGEVLALDPFIKTEEAAARKLLTPTEVRQTA